MTREEYENKRDELVRDFIKELLDSEIVDLHNAYCEANKSMEDHVYCNNEDEINMYLNGCTPYQAIDAINFQHYNSMDCYFADTTYSIQSFNHYDDEGSPIYLDDIFARGADYILDLLGRAYIDHAQLDEDLVELEEEYRIGVSKAEFKEDWEKFLVNRMPIFQFPNGHYCYVQYDEEAETLTTGGICNAGFCHTEDTEELKVDYDFSLDENLQEIYDRIIEKHPEYANAPQQ